ncbi:hypothetical protein VOLCADRAFT_88051 [Volvox carteri f. nagariensis]|uniref:Uncharacterized protein n=1 Tax=Volvox carteri f. nagariensis TaxID=3068 RepID=D8TMY2_VOLCA|nr:uncharacterized protein VOLCADRAFT_88051 [Volvox carteri f. nagariensis]EFJ51332.1 hypothetical protein VOLCADRAFT_88051 [Volvox carteri f. nagariensis]|eukprot:XP_002947799.1 hypothetical protein VOLCADRAFT_88051 [Volvox carteri f. nagariensis]
MTHVNNILASIQHSLNKALLFTTLRVDACIYLASIHHGLNKVAFNGMRPSLDELLVSERCPLKLCRLLVACWETDPDRRPAAAEAIKELALILRLKTAPGILGYPALILVLAL